MVKAQTKKIIATSGMAVAGYFAIIQQFPQLYPGTFLIDNPMFLAIAGGITVWAAYMLWTDF